MVDDSFIVINVIQRSCRRTLFWVVNLLLFLFASSSFLILKIKDRVTLFPPKDGEYT